MRMIRLSLVGRFFFFPPSCSFPRRFTIADELAWLGFTINSPPALGRPPAAAAARFSLFAGFASRMYAERDAARLAMGASPGRLLGCSRICPNCTATRSGLLVLADPSPGTACPAASIAASIAFASVEFKP